MHFYLLLCHCFKMPKSQGSKSAHSGVSRTSINVTLPTTDGAAPRQDTHVISDVRQANRPSSFSQKQLHRMIAVRIIERAWLSYRDHQMFRLLKHAVCAAEHSLSHEILRKVCPKEAEFLRDKALHSKVRFRFGGMEFPPFIYFKIYTASQSGAGMSVRYVSGKRMIQPASEAAKDACELMGHRKFYDQIIEDSIQLRTHHITSEVDVTTLKDYMKYASLLDETPSYLGGRDNSWRKLTLEVLPRQTIFYDVVDFLYHQRMTPRLKEELPALLQLPASEALQRQHIDIISQMRPLSPFVPPNTSKILKTTEGQSSRRSKQARNRANKMKQIYDQEKTAQTSRTDLDDGVAPQHGGPLPPPPTQRDTEREETDEWDAEAAKLFEWTQELSFEELTMTPRLHTVTSSMLH